MKSSLAAPASTAALALRVLASAALLLDPVAADVFPFPTPAFRYTPFQDLDATTRAIAEEQLGYRALTWNTHGLAPIEKLGWTSLTSDQRAGAGLLGYTSDAWDCFVNHYEDRGWDALAVAGDARAHFETLGWTRAHWEYTSATLPYTEGRWWGQLTAAEQEAANGLCYFEDTWNRRDMNPNPGFFPHPVPEFRYVPWDALGAAAVRVAGLWLNYTADAWDRPGTSILEKNTFLNLDADAREGAMELGFYPHTWDCFMNHYRAYYWDSFHDDLLVAMETLGWNATMWREGAAAPASEDLYWIDLRPDEKAAATRLCYFEQVWDQEPLGGWYDYAAGANTAVSAAGPPPDDVDLGIFAETGYVGRAPGSVGRVGAVVAPAASPSRRALVASTVVALVLALGVFLLV